MNKEGIDEYIDDEDPGFDLYAVNEENFVASCKELAQLNNFPARAIKLDTQEQLTHRELYRKLFQEAHQPEPLSSSESKPKKTKPRKEDSTTLLKKMGADSGSKKGPHPGSLSVTGSKPSGLALDDELAGAVDESKEALDIDMEAEEEEDGRKASVLPRWIKFPQSNDEFYPAEFDSVIYDCYNMRVVFDREKTGFEETKDFPIVIGSIVAGRYQVVEYLGSAAFSKAI